MTNLFVEKAKIAANKELSQIHDMDTYTPMDPTMLTPGEKIKALLAILFLSQKSNDSIKGRNMTVGSKQHNYDGYSKSDYALPTVSTNGVILTSTIDANENHGMAILDLPWACL